jgi:hypothetical protein
MLDAMSKILGFTMEEKITLGLAKTNTASGGAGEGGAIDANKGISDKLINFLLDDDE